MALLDFPTGPQLNDTTTQNGNTWKWNGTSWVAFNNLSLTSQVSGILAVQYGGTGFGGTYNKGDILYALSSNTFGKLAAGSGGSILAIDSNKDLYWKVDDAGSGSVGSGQVGGLAYYTTTTNISSGTAFSYINGTSNVVLTGGIMSLIGSTINSGTWAGSAVTAKYGGTGLNAISIGEIIYGSGTDTFARLSAGGSGASVLTQTSGSIPVYYSQAQLVVGGATTAANIQGGTQYNVVYQSNASTTGFVGNAAGSGASVLTQTGNNIPVYFSQSQLVVGGATTAANIQGGAASQLHYQTGANTTGFVSNAAGSGASILSQTGSATPIFLGQAQLVVGGATTSANIQGGAASQILYQSGANTTAFVSNAAGSGASILSQTGSAAPVYLGQAQLVVGGATTAASIQGGSASQLLYQSGANTTAFVSNAAGSGASILTQTGSSAPTFFGQSQLVVGGATTSASIQGGGAGQIPYNSAANTTTFLAHPGAGYALTSVGTGTSVAWQSISTLAVTSLSAGNGINVSGSTGSVTVSNIGVTSITGTANQITVASSLGSSNGAITLSLPQSIASTSSPSFADITLTTGSNSTLANVGSSGTSLVNKQYVDNLASGLDIHGSVRVVSTSAIGASYVQTQAVGNLATGAYLISTTQVALPAIDGVTFTATGTTQRILVAGGATGMTSINGGAFSTAANTNLFNGIYYVGALGGAGTSNWILVRATDTDDNTELTGGTFTFVEEGNLYKDTGWVCTNDTTNLGPIQFGGTAITFSQFSGAASINFGQGLTQVGNAVATNVNLSSSFAASAIGFTQFNIGGAAGAGAAATGYYPTFSVKTNTIHAGTALLTINHTGFSLVGSTNTAATLTVTGNISLPNPGAGGSVAYSSDANTLAFVGGTAEQILKSNGTSAPSFVNQSTLVVGGATTAANIQGGAASQLHYQIGANTTGFVNNAAGSGASILSQTGSAAPIFLGQAQLVVGGATTSANIQGGTQYNVVYQSNTSTTGFVGNAAGSGASVLTQTGNNIPVYFSQSQLVVGGATTSANIQGGAASQLLYQSGANTTAFVSNAAGSGASILTQTGSAAPLFFGQSQLVVGGATTSANIQGGAASQLLYQSGANTTAFVSNAAGSGASILTQTGSATPLFFGQSQLVVGGATTAANIQGGAASQILYQSGANTTAFVSNAAGSGASVLTQTGSAAPVYLGQAQLSVGSATNATNTTNVNVTGATGTGNSYLAFVSGTSGNLPILIDTNITVDANTNTITATNFSGIASSSTRVGITTSVSTSDLPIVFADAHQPYSSLGSSTLLTYQASTGKITNGIWAGTAITTGRGGTGLQTVSANQVLIGAATGNTWAAIASTNIPAVAISTTPPAQPGGAIGSTQPGQLWWDSEYGVLKVFYNDGNTSQWVDATPVLGSSGGGSSVKRSYVMTFGAGFTPSTGADTVQIQVPYAPDNTSKFYYIKRLDYRNETTSGGSGVTFFIERHTTGNVAFSPSFRIHTAGSGVGASFAVGPTTYNTSYTLAATGASFVSSAGVAASIISGDYLRLNFTALGTAATLSVSIVIEEQ